MYPGEQSDKMFTLFLIGLLALAIYFWKPVLTVIFYTAIILWIVSYHIVEYTIWFIQRLEFWIAVFSIGSIATATWLYRIIVPMKKQTLSCENTSLFFAGQYENANKHQFYRAK